MTASQRPGMAEMWTQAGGGTPGYDPARYHALPGDRAMTPRFAPEPLAALPGGDGLAPPAAGSSRALSEPQIRFRATLLAIAEEVLTEEQFEDIAAAFDQHSAALAEQIAHPPYPPPSGIVLTERSPQ